MARRIASSLGEALGRDVSLPLLALVVVFIAIIVVQSSVFSYFGIGLLLGSAVPLVFATIAQGLVIGLSDIDLGVGYGVGLTNAICAGILAPISASGSCVSCVSWRAMPRLGR